MNPTDTAAGRLEPRPRVALVVVDDGLYTHRWVRALLDAPALDVVAAACLSPFSAVGFNPRGARGLWRVSLGRLRYYGPAATARFALRSVRAATADVLFRLGLARQAHSVRSAVRARAIDVFTPPHGDVNRPDFCARLADYRPDLLLCAFSQRAERNFLETPRLGCLNVHFSMLPAHRGREPLFRAMLTGGGAGVSVHWMTPEFDAGAVVLQEPLDLAGCNTLDRLIHRAAELAGRIVPRAVLKAAAWQDDKRGPHELPDVAGWPSREEVARFRQRGLRFV